VRSCVPYRALTPSPSLTQAGGNVVDFHTCDVFPERWFDLVLVLRSDNTVLYDRLAKRGYAQAKLAENVECEIMQTVLEEARESYDEQLVVELRSDTVAEMDANVERVGAWLQQWKADNA
jgi:adenylate kinase